MTKHVLKLRLRNLYKKIESVDMDCGHAMANYISRDLYRYKSRFNKIANKLATIDLDTPVFRYKI